MISLGIVSELGSGIRTLGYPSGFALVASHTCIHIDVGVPRGLRGVLRVDPHAISSGQPAKLRPIGGKYSHKCSYEYPTSTSFSTAPPFYRH